MIAELDSVAPNYRRALERWPDAPTLAAHYRAVAKSANGDGHGLLETVKSFVECVSLTVLAEHGQSPPTASPSTSELLVAALRTLGLENTRGVSKLDKVLSAYNRLSDALTECRNEVGPVAHGKDGFLDCLYSNQLRAYLLTGDALLALLLAAEEGTEPDLRHTREPYEMFTRLHERLDRSVALEAEVVVDDDSDSPVLIVTLGAPGLPEEVELRVEPSRLLYSIDRDAYLELLAASTTEVLETSPQADVGERPPETMPATRLAQESARALLVPKYEGRLAHLADAFDTFLRTRGVNPLLHRDTASASLSASLLATAEAQMKTDWQKREPMQAAMRIALVRTLALFGFTRDDAKEHAEAVVSWLRVQTSADDTDSSPT